MQSVLMRCSGRLCLVLVLAATAMVAGGCGDGDSKDRADLPDAGVPDAAPPDAAVVPAFRTPVDLPDDELADAVLKVLGAPVAGTSESCDRCHGVTRQTMRYWRALGDTALATCLTDLEVADGEAARAMIDCLREDPDNAEARFKPEKLGVYATGAHLPWFSYLFQLAYGDEAEARQQQFVDELGMPRGDLPRLEQDGFDLVAEYFARGLPLLDAKLTADPAPGDCKQGISEDVAAHVDQMRLEGWRAVNQDNAMLMFGCGGAATPRDCLADETRVADWEALPGAVVRSLQTIDYPTAYWSRSSPDGRFVAHGVRPVGAAFVDLQQGTVIDADASYDPGFFPDGSGFAFQRGNQALFCDEAVLSASPPSVTFDEPGCTTNQEVGLYQHLAAALAGGDYFAVHGEFESDDGGHGPTTGDPATSFAANSRLRLTPMIHVDNTGFEAGQTVELDTPYEGDAVLSPSARLVIARVAGADGQLGYVMRRVDATPTDGGYQIDVPEVARYCVGGGKPAFSFDERWLTYHHYVEEADAVDLGFTGPDDPEFQPYLASGAANVYVLDILTGETRRVTTMAPGEYALYPHFRSDGWIYFLVRGLDADETIAATDAALVLEEP
jgi:hypothetical protein